MLEFSAIGDRVQYLGGGTLSRADRAVLPFVERFKVDQFGDRVAAKPHLVEWFERMFARPAVVEAFAFADPGADCT